MLRKLSATQLFSPQCIEATKALRMKKVQELVNFLSESNNLGSYDSKNSSAFQEMVIGYQESIGNPDLANFFPFMRLLDLQNSSRTDEKDVSSRDFLDVLIDLQQGDEFEINIDEIEHLLLDMFVAGTDTNSSTVEWAMAELLRNPTTMKKVQDEINSVIGQNSDFQESDISKLPYLEAVVKETFRLHPAAPFLLPRKAETNVEILGFTVLKDSQVLVNVWAIGRDPNVWENPTHFEPERFLGKEIDVKGTDYELTPFGAGRRICPGLPLAMKIVHLMLASLLYTFEWKLPNGFGSEDLNMEETFGLTVHKTNPLLAVPLKKRAIN
ncbi:unnamed protein product [Arabidopsis thaliana]|uniref:(thale cress) hypothetical protein n=1 Tax=Arabidopsis thaliana TaxID=3702 RepID=A0A7G2DUS5_ARATH|nr:unnamed protein product [Arabidopsis thaliana]